MIFYRANRESTYNRSGASTMGVYSMKLANEERCAHFLALFAVVFLIVSAVMLYFAIVTEYSEQKTIYYIVFVIGVLAVMLFAGLAWFILGRIREKRECFWHIQMNTQAARRMTRMKQEEVNDSRASQTSLNQTPKVSMNFVNQSFQPETQVRREKLVPRF